MQLLILIAVAVAIPLGFVFYLLTAEAAAPERSSRAWRALRYAGTAISLLVSAIAIVFAIVYVVASWARFAWSDLAVSLLIFMEGAQGVVWSFPRRTRPETRRARSHFIRGVGYIAIAMVLTISAVVESPLNLVFAALLTWLGVMFLSISRKATQHSANYA